VTERDDICKHCMGIEWFAYFAADNLKSVDILSYAEMLQMWKGRCPFPSTSKQTYHYQFAFHLIIVFVWFDFITLRSVMIKLFY
jgi:hypothetical protein